jgi:N-acetyl-beta-hexosaminidase
VAWPPVDGQVLRRVVDSMAAAKLNVLHVHWVDSQAFPLVLPSAPRLSKGAHSAVERYSLAEVGVAPNTTSGDR